MLRVLVIRCYEAEGNRAKAVEIYHVLRELLAAELGTVPSAETEALYRHALA
ncbi:MAG: BTAD domain-containing putative transcriptional regulator [Chloroflexi bacterium]|nr:BTAD domain-containing putative transcriptional regulator [Chloroflexota bacterium]